MKPFGRNHPSLRSPKMDQLSQKSPYILNPGIQILIIVLILQNLLVGPSRGFSSGKAGFAVKFKDEISPYRVIGIFVLPNERLTLEALDTAKKDHYVLKVSAGKVTSIAVNKWHWRAPGEIGLYPAKIIQPHTADSITLNIFVMVPYNRLKGEYLNGYRIGTYPSGIFKQLLIYKPPRGFIEVTKENEETLVAPHFKLEQFLCNQEGSYPKYLVLKEQLLSKLELILEKVNEEGYRCEAFNIMSGYRTPYYNRAIGNVKYSRHLWGDAADIFIDENPKNGIMDDLNRDGRIDYRDAAILYNIIDGMYGKPWYRRFIGGLARYKKTTSHGPFVHVDVRGFRARWGD
jgi:hypothetical protein